MISGLPSGPTIVDERMVSRFQFARPAVVFNFLLQMIFTPPVEAASLATWLLVMTVSSSMRNVSAKRCLRSANAFLASFIIRFCFTGLFFGEKRASSDIVLLLEKRDVGGGLGALRGEYSSFQSLTTSWLQKSSTDGPWGVEGMRWIFLGDCKPLGLSSGLPGGVVKRSSLETFLAFFPGGVLQFISNRKHKTSKEFLTT